MAYSSARDNPNLSETLRQASGSHGMVSFHSSRSSPQSRVVPAKPSVKLSVKPSVKPSKAAAPELKKTSARPGKRLNPGVQRTTVRNPGDSSGQARKQYQHPAPKPVSSRFPEPAEPSHSAFPKSPEHSKEPEHFRPAPPPEQAERKKEEPKPESKPDPAIPQATPVTGHFNIVCLTAMGYNRLIDLLLREANYYDQLGGIGKEATQVMENMVYTFSHSSSKFTALDGSKEVLLTIMDEDFTNILGILLKAAYSGKEDPQIDYSEKLPYAGA